MRGRRWLRLLNYLERRLRAASSQLVQIISHERREVTVDDQGSPGRGEALPNVRGLAPKRVRVTPNEHRCSLLVVMDGQLRTIPATEVVGGTPA